MSNLNGYEEQKNLFASFHNQDISDEELKKNGINHVSSWKELE